MGARARKPIAHRAVGTLWKKGERVIQVSTFYPAETPLDVERIGWVKVQGRPGRVTGEMDYGGLLENWEQVRWE